jgi:PAS domain-containing protein
MAAKTGRFTTEAWRCRKDGGRFWAMVVIDAIRRDDQLIGFAKITRDMTEQRAAQLAALESERRFRLLVQGVTDYAIYMLSPEGRITNWNMGAERIKGYASSEITGEHFSRFIRRKTARPVFAIKRWKRLGATVVMRPKVGVAGKTAVASGPG